MRSVTGTRPSFRSESGLSRKPRTVFDNIVNNDIVKENTINTASFLHDPDGSSLKSTQELPVDYTQFENHTFFNSARSKVDISFDQIINHFPYDKKRSDIELFLNKLTGFERHVYDQFPKHTGFITLSGSSSPSLAEGHYIEIRDGKSLNFPTLENKNFGVAVLDPNLSPFTFELQIKIPEQANKNEVIFQRNSSTAGITLALSQSASTTNCNIVFLVSSASESYVIASGSINKGKWIHLSPQLTEHEGAKRAVIFLNQSASYFSSDTQDFGSLSFEGESIYIGSGTSHSILDYSFEPKSTLSCSIDEFRYYKSSRSIDELKKFAKREVYPDDDMLAYFKFNEPYGSYAGNNVALDSSGNKLHSYITNFKVTMRSSGSLTEPLTYENIAYSPNLFANHDDVIALNTNLLEDAESFDNDNPNFIMKLVPPHYFTQGAQLEGLSRIDQNLGNRYTAISIPGTGRLNPPQLTLSFLLAYAKFYDEIKLMIDYFSHVNYVELDDPESAIDKFLPYVAKFYGFNLPNFFTNSTPDQFFYGQTLENNYSISSNSLKNVRYQIWRRILGNITDLIMSKGTRSSIRSAILSTGIIPENFFNIREFGGPSQIDLKGLRQQTQETSTMLDMSGTLAAEGSSPTSAGFFSNIPNIISPFLSASRVEPGLPNIAGSFVSDGSRNVSNNINDGLLTSGSFSIEGIVKFPPTVGHKATQSIFRLQTTGSSSPSNVAACLLNVVYEHNAIDESGSLKLYVRSSKETTAPTLSLSIGGVNLFNGEKWYVSTGRVRADLTSSLSSSYYLRCGFLEDKTTYTYFSTSSYFEETATGNVSQDLFQNIDSSYNASGTFLTIGSQSLSTTSTRFLNTSTTYASTNFSGRISQIRFWSKGLDEIESVEHLRNYRSLGVENPELNFNFNTQETGSFERLRIDVSTDQLVTSSNGAGKIILFDFSQNNYHLTGSTFENDVTLIKNEIFAVNRISPSIDLLQTDDKVRVRSMLNLENTDSYTQPAPLYTLGQELAVNDDNRFSIEYSAIKALNEDIVGIIGNTQYLDDALGHTSLLFDNAYPDFDYLSQIYFQRLVNPINLRTYIDLFKWFDLSLTELVSQLIPRKTNFLGINYVIESHILERHRHRYLFDKQYLGKLKEKQEVNNNVQDYQGTIKRY